jgi:hypothetical protein
MTTCPRQTFIPPPTLVQLRRRFTAPCSSLRLSVETVTEGWMARVCDSGDGPALYSAFRCSLVAAMAAAAEFAAFRIGFEPRSPELMARQLAWKESSQ